MIAQAVCVDWNQMSGWLTRNGEFLLVIATFLLVVATFLLWRTTKKAARIAEASHALAKHLAELQMQPAFRVEAEEIEPPPEAYIPYMQGMYNFKAKSAIDRFRGLKVTNVGRGPAQIQKVLYGDKEDCGPGELGQGLLIYYKMFARFDLKGLKSIFSEKVREVDCRIEYSDCESPSTTQVYCFRLRFPQESGATIQVIPAVAPPR
ncbi:MAG: hypothetical protein IMZ44_03770 [Planctomycetes bacterium]|nr:hypothetical protein [Planctomycetota bacterium]